jgi:prephenate dehydrogenase
LGVKAGKQCVVLAITVPQIAAVIKELRGNLKAGRERRQ